MQKMNLYAYRLAGWFRRTFFMALPENEQDYENSRAAFILSEAAGQTIAQFNSGTFLTAVLTYLGLTDGAIGMVMAIATLATVSDLFTMNYVQHLCKRKLFVCVMVLQKIWFAVMYFIPLLHWSQGIKIFLFILCLSIGQISTQVSTPAINDWIGDLVPVRSRGAYFAKKDAISIFAVICSMLGMAFVFDHFRENSHFRSYPVIGTATLILAVLNFAGLAAMKEARQYPLDADGKEMHGSLRRRAAGIREDRMSLRDTIAEVSDTFRNDGFRRALAVTCLWNIAFYIAAPFNNSYQLKELGLSFTYIMVVGFIFNMVRVFLTPVIGRKADKIGMADMEERVLGFYAGYYFFTMLAVPGNGQILYILSVACSSVAWCFINIGILCIQFEFLDEKCRMFQFSLLIAVSGLTGFVTSVLAGLLLNFLQKHPVVISGKSLYAQQTTNFLGLLMVLLTILYLDRRVKNQNEKS